MIATKTAAGYRQPGRIVLPAQKWKHFVQDIPLILQVPEHTHPGMNALVVPAFCIHRIQAEHLQLTSIDFGCQHPNHALVLKIEKLAPGSGEYQYRRAPMSEDQYFHIA